MPFRVMRNGFCFFQFGKWFLELLVAVQLPIKESAMFGDNGLPMRPFICAKKIQRALQSSLELQFRNSFAELARTPYLSPPSLPSEIDWDYNPGLMVKD